MIEAREHPRIPSPMIRTLRRRSAQALGHRQPDLAGVEAGAAVLVALCVECGEEVVDVLFDFGLVGEEYKVIGVRQ